MIYDRNSTCAKQLSEQSGYEVVDEDGTRPFVIAPDADQKYYLQQTPLAKLITQIAKGGKVGDSALYASPPIAVSSRGFRIGAL